MPETGKLATTTVAAAIEERLHSNEDVAAGKDVYATNCFPCHGQHGEGGIGPNLTDDYWIHGGKSSDIVRVISNGVPDKGMTSWLPILGENRVVQLAAFIISLHGTSPPGAKAPQGELFKP